MFGGFFIGMVLRIYDFVRYMTSVRRTYLRHLPQLPLDGLMCVEKKAIPPAARTLPPPEFSLALNNRR